MTDEPNEQMSAETREFLGDLSRDDIAVIKRGLPILKAVLGFGVVMRWIAITLGAILAAGVFFAESINKIIGFFWPPPHP